VIHRWLQRAPRCTKLASDEVHILQRMSLAQHFEEEGSTAPHMCFILLSRYEDAWRRLHEGSVDNASTRKQPCKGLTLGM